MNEEYLRGLMERYTTDHLIGITPEDFKAKIDEFLALDDHEMEGWESPDKQRDKSVKFLWGHNHDFGTFKLEGAMEDRHIRVIAKFIEMGLPMDLTDKRVLDIGVWCGGTSLLLAAMGGRIRAIEEVQKYNDCAWFLACSFDIMWKNQSNDPMINMLTYHGIDALSLYQLEYAVLPKGGFDYVSFPGVLYHLTDPIIALRIIYNSLKNGGKMFLETMTARDSAHDAKILQYHGPSEPGWNWFAPTPATLRQMMLDVGFEDVRVQPTENQRAYAVGTRKSHKDILRAGLSRRDIR